MPSDCSEYNDFLPYIGEFGAYQKWLLACMMPAGFLFAFTYLGHIFMILVPDDHWCRIRALESRPYAEQLKLAIPKDSHGEYHQCSMYDVDFNWADTNITKANESWPQVPCNDGWVYNRDEVPYPSIATENDWVCENYVMGTYTVAIFFLGSLFGCLILGFVTDHCGRVWSFFLANFAVLVGGLASPFCHGFYYFLAARFVVGLGYNYCFIAIYILTLENVGARYRSLVANLALGVAFTVGAVCLPWLAYVSGNWRMYALLVCLPVMVLVLMCFFIPESPTWLLSVGKIDRGMEILQKAADINGRNLSDSVWKDLRRCYTLNYAHEQEVKRYTAIDLFNRCRRCCIMLIMIKLWMVVALVYDIQVRASVMMGTDVFVMFSLSSLTEFPAAIIALFLVEHLGRKPTTVGALAFSALFSIVAALLDQNWDAGIAALFARLFTTVAFNSSQQWGAEILPTVVRGQGLAVCNLMGAVGAFGSPFVIYTQIIYEGLPMIVSAILCISTGLLILLLPETKGFVLPHTPEEAEHRWTLSCKREKD